MWTNIVFSEYLPIILDPVTYASHGLAPDSSTYDPTLNPDLNTEFTSAAFRLGHTQVPDVVTHATTDFEDVTNIPIREVNLPQFQESFNQRRKHTFREHFSQDFRV